MLGGVGLLGRGLARPYAEEHADIFYDFTSQSPVRRGPALSFTRTTSATYFDGAGVAQTAASGAARYGAHYYNGTVWVNSGVLLEGARTNLNDYSADLTNWDTVTSTTHTTGQSSIFGDTSAVDFDHTANGATQNNAVTYTNASHTAGAIVQYVDSQWVYLQIAIGGTSAVAWFDLSAGSAGGTAGAGFESSRISALGSNRYLIETTGTVGAGAGTVVMHNVTGSVSFTEATSVSTISHAVQAELGTSASMPIVTAGSTGTRNADVLSATISDPVKTLFIEGRAPGATTSGVQNVLAQLDDGTENNRVRIVRDGGANLRLIVTTSGTEVANLNMGQATPRESFRAAIVFEDNNFKAIKSGGTEQTDTSGTAPTGLTTLRFGRDTSGTEWYGHATRFKGWAEVKSSAVLAGLVA